MESGCAELTGGGVLIDAWAVLADSEDVGGPEENIERFGVVNCEGGCEIGLDKAEWTSGAEPAWTRGAGREEKTEPWFEASAGCGDDVSLEVDEGNVHNGSCAWENWVDWVGIFRSARRFCIACDEVSGLSDSSGPDSMSAGSTLIEPTLGDTGLATASPFSRFSWYTVGVIPKQMEDVSTKYGYSYGGGCWARWGKLRCCVMTLCPASLPELY